MTEAVGKYLHVEAVVNHLPFKVLKWLMYFSLQIIFTDLSIVEQMNSVLIMCIE